MDAQLLAPFPDISEYTATNSSGSFYKVDEPRIEVLVPNYLLEWCKSSKILELDPDLRLPENYVRAKISYNDFLELRRHKGDEVFVVLRRYVFLDGEAIDFAKTHGLTPGALYNLIKKENLNLGKGVEKYFEILSEMGYYFPAHDLRSNLEALKELLEMHIDALPLDGYPEEFILETTSYPMISFTYNPDSFWAETAGNYEITMVVPASRFITRDELKKLEDSRELSNYTFVILPPDGEDEAVALSYLIPPGMFKIRENLRYRLAPIGF